MLRTNKHNTLKRAVSKRLIWMSVKEYKRYKAKPKLMINNNYIAECLSIRFVETYRSMLMVNKYKTLKRLVNKKILDLSL